MMRKLGMILVIAGMVSFVGACSDDNGNKIRLDGGGVPKDGGGVPKDGGGVPKDGGGEKNCKEIFQCAVNCGSDQTCIAACVAKGSADGQAKFNALSTCLDNASKDSCANDCADPKSSACATCLQNACGTELDSCGVGGNPPVGDGKWGDPCSLESGCESGLDCVTFGSAGKSFCTQKCTNQGQECTGTPPAGTKPFCVLSDKAQTTFWCAFLCKAQSQTFPCPTELTCGPEEKGNAACEP